MMQRLLVPIDGSECSLRAVRHVIDKAARFGKDGLDVHLVNVQPPLPSGVTAFLKREQVSGFHDDMSAEAMGAARRLLDEAGVRYQAHAMVGPLAETIVELAGSLGCDEIVMGSRGRTALGDFFMGSTVTRVVHLAELPVLLIK